MVVIPPELRALEDKAFDRWMIDGVRYEWPHRFRGMHEAITFTRIMLILGNWVESCSDRQDVVLTDIGFWLANDPFTALDPPISVTVAEVVARTSPDDCWIAGVPKLVVEIIGHQQHPEWGQRIAGYRNAGVPVVWLVDPTPDRRKVHVLRQGFLQPVALDPSQVLTCPDQLPGFSAPVADFFR